MSHVHLLRKLDAAAVAGCRLSLLSAPLGYGKSTLLAQYAGTLARSWAWVRCASADNQPLVFLVHLASALQLPDAIMTASSEEPIWLEIVDNLEQRREPLTLFLDDIHHLRSKGTCNYLNELLEFAPKTLHVVAASRGQVALSISHLRRDQRLQLLNATDLALDSAQIEELASCRGLKLDGDAIYQLRASSEGWISGVLLALDVYIETSAPQLKNTSRLVSQRIAQFIEEELLRDLPADLIRFIERTSVVSTFDERLATHLCPELNATNAVRRLQRSDLLIQQPPEDQQTYRYHPALRNTVYQKFQRRNPEALRTLHCQAAQWLLNNQCYSEAVYQLGRAQEYDRLLAVVEQHSFDLLREGKLDSVVDFLMQWPEQDMDHLTLAITEASTVIASNDIVRASNCLLRLQRLLRRGELPSHRPERLLQTVAFLRCRLAVLGGNFEHGLHLASKVLQHHPQRNAASAVLQFNQASCLFALGRLGEAQKSASAALEELTRLGFRGYTNSLNLLLAQIELAQGHADKAQERFVIQEQQSSVAGPSSFYDIFRHLGLGLALLQQNRFEAAQRRFSQAEVLALDVVHCAALPWVLHHKACLLEACGETEQARKHWDESRRLALQHKLFALYRLVGSWRVRLAVREQDEDFICLWLKEWHWCHRHYDAQLQPEEWLAYAWVQRRQGQHAMATRIAAELMRHGQKEGNVQLQLQLHLFEAALHQDLKRHGELTLSLEQAIQLAIRYNVGQLLHQEGRLLREELLQLFSSQYRRQHNLPALPPHENLMVSLQSVLSGDGAQVGLIEPLTRREQEVLRQMLRGQGNQQIAEGLFISLSTVKTHINNLFRKLDAVDRETALLAAKRLKLLEL